MNIENFNVEKAIKGPSLCFTKPNDIIFCPYLDRDQKIKALENWKSMLTLLSRTSDEGMLAEVDKNVPLSEVIAALERL